MLTNVVLALTAAWHFLAAWHFTLFPARTLARTTDERPPSPIAAELFRFLGGLNFALVILALASLWLPEAQRWPALGALTIANLSQFLVDVRVKRLEIARGFFFMQILVGDLLFTLANAAAILISARYR